MFVVLNRYTVIVRQYGLRNIARKIWRGGIFFALIHAAVFWYAKYQIGDWGDKLAALSRKFDNQDTLWGGVVTVLGFPVELFGFDGMVYFALAVLNSIAWGLILSFLIVPAFVKKG